MTERLTPAAAAAITPAAAAAIDTDPAEILRRWFATLGAAARMKYGQALRLFTTWATGATDPQPEDALRLLVDAGRVGARQLAIGWRDSMLTAGRASGTVAGLVSALASLVTACRLCGLVEWHLEAVAPKVEPRHDRSGPPRHQVEQLLAHLDEQAAAGDSLAVRDVAIARLLHNAALRRSEVVSLRWPLDVQLEHAEGPTVFPKLKGKKEQEPIRVGRRTAASLTAWLRVRGDHAGPLFYELRSPRPEDATALSGEAVRLMLNRQGSEAGCKATFRPHGLRHAAATWCATHGSLGDLMRLGGWATLSGARTYVDDMTPIVKPKLLDLMDL